MEQPINIVRGTTKTLDVSVMNGNTNYVLQSGETLRFAIKRKPEDTVTELSRDFGTTQYDSNNHCYVLTISPADTENLRLGQHYYDVGLQIGTDYYPIIDCSPFIILPNISSRRVENVGT